MMELKNRVLLANLVIIILGMWGILIMTNVETKLCVQLSMAFSVIVLYAIVGIKPITKK